MSFGTDEKPYLRVDEEPLPEQEKKGRKMGKALQKKKIDRRTGGNVTSLGAHQRTRNRP